MIRQRTFRADDELWEALVALAERNGRTAAEETRIAIAAHLRTAANVTLPEPARKPRAPHPNARQTHKMKDAS